MKIFAVSDIHIDYPQNKKWLFELSTVEYQDDILIVAGDITDDLVLLESCFRHLSSAFHQVLYVPGNHELWVIRDKIKCSLQKFSMVSNLATECDISMSPYRFGSVSIIPLLSWYDFSFGGEPNEEIKTLWSDFRNCVWPKDFQVGDINSYFLDKNIKSLQETNKTIISFSHFLPCIEVMPRLVPEKYRVLYPVLGSEALGRQVTKLNPLMHVYGHSHVKRNINISGIKYINSAFGYPEEPWSNRELLCVYEY